MVGEQGSTIFINSTYIVWGELSKGIYVLGDIVLIPFHKLRDVFDHTVGCTESHAISSYIVWCAIYTRQQ